jgi:hypothetical protein
LTQFARNILSAIKWMIVIVANSMNFEKLIYKDTIMTFIKIKTFCFFFRRLITSFELFAICIISSWKMLSD